MIDHAAATLALRARALTLTVCTTGSMSLSATTTGYHRADGGSFVTDGFAAGMEITPSGFATNTVDVITAVTATDLTTANARTAEATAGSRTIAVKLPALRAWENVAFTPTTGRPYLEEDYVPATTTLMGQRTGGAVYEDGLYVLKWYGLPNYGITALRKGVDALKLLFAPGTALVAGSNTIRVRTDTSVYAGQILPQDTGWSVVVLTIPWRAESVNAIAA